jgi:hypothetical protein
MIVQGDQGDLNPLLGFSEEGKKLSPEEEDQVERSEKKVKKRVRGEFTGDSSVPISYEGIYQEPQQTEDTVKKVSYKQSLLGSDEIHIEGVKEGDDVMVENDDDEEGDNEFGGLSVEEKKVGQYDCPSFILSEKEEKRISKPWRQGVIVKLMGRRIGYKALETRLKQMWVRKGVINIIDLGKEYYLVYFSNEEDYTKSLEEGPWLIYDHYLVVREWCPNFYPGSATIDKTAVWVRIPDLPIEYYDAKVLHFIGNRIGKTVKVDKNTLFQERGKYASICVEVELNKPLLAMFELKDRIYKIEYEGLHMLCFTCGRFGQYVEGCPEKATISGNPNNEVEVETHGEDIPEEGAVVSKKWGGEPAGPWVVVQKPRRSRKGQSILWLRLVKVKTEEKCKTGAPGLKL